MKRLGLVVVMAACASNKAPLVVDRLAVDDDVYFCRYKKNPFRMAEGTLALGTEEPAIFTMPKDGRDVGLELTLPWGSAEQPMRATFTTGWVTYRMLYRPKEPLSIYPLTPQRAGVLELGQYTQLAYLGNADKRMRLRVEPPAAFKPVRPLALTLRCDETAITASGQGLEPEPATADGGSPPQLVLAREQDIPVSAEPGGAAEGTLRYGKDAEPRADLLEERAGAVRIRVLTWPGRVTGWVPRKQTSRWVPDKDALSSIFGMGGLGLRGSRDGEGKPAWSRCATGVPLYLVRNAALEPAGELLAKAAYEVVKETDGWTEIALPENAWLKLEPGLTWAFKPGDLEVCRTTPVKPRS